MQEGVSVAPGGTCVTPPGSLAQTGNHVRSPRRREAHRSPPSTAVAHASDSLSSRPKRWRYLGTQTPLHCLWVTGPDDWPSRILSSHL